MDDGSALAQDLRAENECLRARLDELVIQAERNHEIMCRHQAFDLEIVAASGFPTLVGTIFRSLPIVSSLDAVTLTLVDVGADIHTVMDKLGMDFAQFPDLVFVENEAALPFKRNDQGVPKPLLRAYDAAAYPRLFPHPPEGMASVALVPLLRNRRLIGSLNLGSRDAQRFTAAMGTDFVEHMASIIAICLENVISNEMLKYIGLTDSLTGVYNRRYIDRRLMEEIARARRQGYRISCMYIDIDYFKHVNDTVGHQAGDEVLREVANRIKLELRLSDALARFGGEEFVALLIDAQLDAATIVAERVRASVEREPVLLSNGLKVPVTVSVGVTTLTDLDCQHAIDSAAQHLVARADTALYRAKEGGRNRVISLA
ncbi:MAG: DUF484 family protein [Telluria sp.]